MHHDPPDRTARPTETLFTAEPKLRFRLRDADLFSYLPARIDPAATDLARFQTKDP